jgi:hypothetical protein
VATTIPPRSRETTGVGAIYDQEALDRDQRKDAEHAGGDGLKRSLAPSLSSSLGYS